MELKRTKTGIEGLDKYIEGGFLVPSVNIIAGEAGTGKTIFGLQFIYNGIVKMGESGIILSLKESKEMIYRHGISLGYDFEKLEEENELYITSYEAVELERLVERGGSVISEAIREIDAKRLMVDALDMYLLLYEESYKEITTINQFFNFLRKEGLVSVLLMQWNERYKATFMLADSIILLWKKLVKKGKREKIERFLRILKMLDTQYEEKNIPFQLSRKGIVVK